MIKRKDCVSTSCINVSSKMFILVYLILLLYAFIWQVCETFEVRSAMASSGGKM